MRDSRRMVEAKTYRPHFKAKLELVSNCAWTRTTTTCDDDEKASSSIVFLDALEKEIANEKKGGREGEEENEENDIDINEEFVERVLYSRLSVSPSSSLGRRGEQINGRQQNLLQSKFK